MKFCLLVVVGVFLAVANSLSPKGLRGIEVLFSSSTSRIESLKCAKESSDFLVFRFPSTPDSPSSLSDACSSLVASKKVGFGSSDVIVHPTLGSHLTSPDLDLVFGLTNCEDAAWSKRIWIDAQHSQFWSLNSTENIIFVQTLKKKCLDNNVFCGLSTSSESFESLFRGHAASVLESFPVWFIYTSDDILEPPVLNANIILSSFSSNATSAEKQGENCGIKVLSTHLVKKATSDACTGCLSNVCILLPGQSGYPCYQGPPADAAHCFDTDPLLSAGTFWRCDSTCADNGFTHYNRNDPIYKTIELWGQ